MGEWQGVSKLRGGGGGERLDQRKEGTRRDQTHQFGMRPALLQVLEDSFIAGQPLNCFVSLPQLGRRMAEFPVDPMMSKMLIASEK